MIRAGHRSEDYPIPFGALSKVTKFQNLFGHVRDYGLRKRARKKGSEVTPEPVKQLPVGSIGMPWPTDPCAPLLARYPQGFRLAT